MIAAMSEDAIATAGLVLRGQSIASLGTLHAGEPAVSMVPFAIMRGGALVIHVSRLSSHTADMVAHPRVSILVVDGDAEGIMPQARARVSIEGGAERLDDGTPEAAQAREAYQARFPDAAPIFELADFALFAIRPRTVRVIGGFGRATTLSPEQFAAAIG